MLVLQWWAIPQQVRDKRRNHINHNACPVNGPAVLRGQCGALSGAARLRAAKHRSARLVPRKQKRFCFLVDSTQLSYKLCPAGGRQRNRASVRGFDVPHGTYRNPSSPSHVKQFTCFPPMAGSARTLHNVNIYICPGGR